MKQLQAQYKKSIRVFYQRDEWFLETDKGQRYNLSSNQGTHTPWSDWMDKQTRRQYKDLRDWQKSIFQMWAMAFDPVANLTLFTAWRKGAGYNQDHDIAVAYDNTNKTWLISTQEDFWIQKTQYKDFELTRDTSYGSLLDVNTRNCFYTATDNIKETA